MWKPVLKIESPKPPPGVISDDCRIFAYDIGQRYDGQLSERFFCHGKGEATYQGDKSYFRHEGSWNNGYMEGKGITTFTNKISESDQSNKNLESFKFSFEGDWVNGKRNGKGVLIFDSGSSFQGEFNHGKIHGFGIFKCSQFRYEGNFMNGCVSERGKVTYISGQLAGREVKKVWPQYTRLSLWDALEYIENEIKENLIIKLESQRTSKMDNLSNELNDEVERVKYEIRTRREEMIAKRNEKVRQTKIQNRRYTERMMRKASERNISNVNTT